MKAKRIKINPREPLTQKAYSAIQQYVVLDSKKKGPYLGTLVKSALKAEKMKRTQLYDFLEQAGYKWNKGYWIKHQEMENVDVSKSN